MLTLRNDYRVADFRPKIFKLFRTCSCGAAFADLASLDEHLEEYGDDSNHVEMAFDLNALVRLGIRRIRIERGLSMNAMADLLGVHVSAVSRIESGKRHAIGWGRTPRSVAAMLGIEVRELLRVCRHCGYRPPDGCACQWCGMPGGGE
jgi:DNA-binding XRE family transcriptional regulator